MKILTVCQGGHVRSVGLKYLLRYKYGHDVLACGWEANSQETRDMLCEWADKVILLDKDFEKYINPKFKSKLFCYHVGNDIFGNPFHPVLLNILGCMIKAHKYFIQNE
jgi:predicted protein tyrosine phosphatase